MGEKEKKKKPSSNSSVDMFLSWVVCLIVWSEMFDINNASWVSRKYLKVGEKVFFWGIFVISVWAFLVTQAVRKLPARQEMWVWSMGWERSPGEGNDDLTQYYFLENSMDRGGYSPWGHKKMDTTGRLILWLHCDSNITWILFSSLTLIPSAQQHCLFPHSQWLCFFQKKSLFWLIIIKYFQTYNVHSTFRSSAMSFLV